jgi:hypothetical protein
LAVPAPSAIASHWSECVCSPCRESIPSFQKSLWRSMWPSWSSFPVSSTPMGAVPLVSSGMRSWNVNPLLRLTRALFQHEPSATYADYYERVLYNWCRFRAAGELPHVIQNASPYAVPGLILGKMSQELAGWLSYGPAQQTMM